MQINRGFENSRQVAKEAIEALRADKPIDRIDPTLVRDLNAYARISREHYTGDFGRIAEVRRAYRRIDSRFPFQAEELISEFFNSEVRQSIMRQESPQES